MRSCPSCKAEVPLDAKFCRQCGTPLKTDLNVQKTSKEQVASVRLTAEQQQKFREYAPEGEGWTDRGQKFFFSITANNALASGDKEIAIFAGEAGLKAKGLSEDQHFIYNALIQASRRLGDKESAKRYCLAELEEIPNLNGVLTKDFDTLPPSIPCRDELLEIALEQDDYNEARRFVSLFANMGLFTKEEAEQEARRIEKLRLKHKAQTLLDSDNPEKAKQVFDEIIRNDKSDAAECYKTLGNYYLTSNQSEEAFYYFQKALDEDPLIKGIQNKLKKLAKELNVETKARDEEVASALCEKEKYSTDWWEKRNVADEYVKIKRFDDAWRNYNQAILIRGRSGEPCDTIYSRMAKMLEKKGQYENALFYYLLSYRESFQYNKRRGFNGPEPPKYIPQGIDRCLTKLGTRNVDNATLLNLVKQVDSAQLLRKSVNELIAQNKS